ncbi:MAG TPA: hypothetical protein VF665_19175 [Longimicrobium sp.]|jgi:hypothetical protein|uniref:hypothetical protein n=1 Tax=Longimicrobium sp. TaxID=2029185 RepID=UPI002ED8AC46
MIFNCPVCSTSLGELATAGNQTLFCAKCQFKYHVAAGTVVSSDSRQITHRPQGHQHRGRYEREYEFRLAQPEGLRVITLRRPQREEQLSAKPNDVVAVVSAMRGNTVENPVAFINQTTRTVSEVGRPGQTTLVGSLIIGAMAGILTLFALSGLGVPGAIPMAVGLLVFALVAFGVQEKLKPRHKVTPSQQAAFSRTATLLQQKAGLEQRILEITNDRREKLAIRDQLAGLRAKMQDVGSELYQTRIDRIDGALPLLEEQAALNDKLLHSYSRTLKMVEIEIESNHAADALPETLSLDAIARRDEIAAIEARTADLRQLLSANEEVERYLRAG